MPGLASSQLNPSRPPEPVQLLAPARDVVLAGDLDALAALALAVVGAEAAARGRALARSRRCSGRTGQEKPVGVEVGQPPSGHGDARVAAAGVTRARLRHAVRVGANLAFRARGAAGTAVLRIARGVRARPAAVGGGVRRAGPDAAVRSGVARRAQGRVAPARVAAGAAVRLPKRGRCSCCCKSGSLPRNPPRGRRHRRGGDPCRRPP